MEASSASSSSEPESGEEGFSGKDVLLLGADDEVPKYTFGNRRLVSHRQARPTVKKRRLKNSATAASLPRPATGKDYDGKEIQLQAENSNSTQEMERSIMFDDNETEETQMVEDDMIVVEDLIENYLILVLQGKVFSVIDDNAMTFILQDFDQSLQRLVANRYCIIHRKIFCLMDGKMWTLTCSCDKSRQQYIQSLNNALEINEAEFNRISNSKHDECIHVKAGKELVGAFDRVNDIDQFAETENTSTGHEYGKNYPEIQDLNFSGERLICIRSNDSPYGIIGFNRLGFVCHSCIFCKYSCAHIQSLKQLLAQNNESVPDFVLEIDALCHELQNTEPSIQLPTAVSSCRIKWETTSSQQKIYKLEYARSEDETLVLMPPSNRCPICSNEISEPLYPSNKMLYLLSSYVPVKVFVRLCSSCPFVRQFCGSSDGILHMGSFLIGHDVLRDYLFLFLTGNSCSIVGFYEKWKLTFEAAGLSHKELLSYHQLRFSWYCFLNLIDIDYEDGFTCEVCGQFPTVISCDATTLGYRRSYFQDGLLASRSGTRPENALEGSRYRERTMLVAKAAQGELMKLCNGQAFDMEKLLQLLNKHCPSVANFFQWLLQVYERSQLIPVPVLKFLKCIASVSPVCSYFPPSGEFNEVLTEIKSGLILRNEPEKLLKLQNSAPIIFKLLTALPTGAIPEELKALFEIMENKLQLTFARETHYLEPFQAEEAFSGNAFLPNWPQKNHRGLYRQDLVSRCQNRRKDDCTKDYRGHPRLMPGIFTLYCEHDICYGFNVMGAQESPNVPFTIFRTRFEEAPAAIIYDNCCNLHTYCLNRDPSFFMNTSFLVDRFHWKNHKACAESYNLSCYPKYDKLNSQINEQRNAKLKRAKSQLSYMNPTNFVNHARLILWYENKKAKAKIHPTLQ